MRIVLIDCSYLCYQAWYTTGGLTTSNNDPSGIVFGFLKRILYLSTYLESNRFVFLWDSKKSYRKRRFPEYKKSRGERTEEEWEAYNEGMKQFDALRRRILPALGFNNVLIQAGCEADDLIAEICCKELDDLVVITADEDMYQVLRPTVSIYTPTSQKHMTHKKFKEKYGISPLQWSMVKAIAGCSSDEIPGIAGIGPTYAAQYINGVLKGKRLASIECEEGQAIIKRNLPLVKLPYPKTRPIQLVYDSLSLDAFMDVCIEFEMDSLADAAESWDKAVIGGHFDRRPVRTKKKRSAMSSRGRKRR